MRFRKYKINKNSSRVVLHKFSSVVIKKNPNIEKEHVITKIKKHERFYTLCLTGFIVFSTVCAIVLMGTSYKHFKKINEFYSGDLTIEYTPSVNGIGDVITLDDSMILEDKKIKDDENYRFTITNNGYTKTKYKIYISVDKDLIELDGCEDNLYDDFNIKYNFNKGGVFTLNNRNVDNQYILVEDVIPAKSTKYYSLNVWLDKNTKFEGKHFHGIIEVDVEKEAC